MLTPGFEIYNGTHYPLSISLEQVGPLYYGVIQPGEVFRRDTGSFWFTVKAMVSLDGKEHIDDWDCVWPAAAVAGGVILGALTGGFGALALAGAKAGAAGASVGLTVAWAAVGTKGAVLTGEVVEGTGSGSDAVARKMAEITFTPTAMNASQRGCYAGPPWPVRDTVEPYTVIGGPAQPVLGADGLAVFGPSQDLQIVPGRFLPPPLPQEDVEVKYGDTYHVKNHYPPQTFLDACGSASGSPSTRWDVSTSTVPDRGAGGTGDWELVPANGGRRGHTVKVGDLVHLKNLCADGSFLDICSPASGAPSTVWDVSTSTKSNRDSGTGIWKIVGHGSRPGQVLWTGMKVSLQNQYVDRTYLDVCGHASGAKSTLFGVSTSSDRDRDGGTGVWSVERPIGSAEPVPPTNVVNYSPNPHPHPDSVSDDPSGDGGQRDGAEGQRSQDLTS